jgi:CRP-like cAMP-binding protein
MVKTSHAVKCSTCPLRQRANYRPFTETEAAFVQKFKSGDLVIQAGATLYAEGTDSAHLYTVRSGWAFRHKLLEDGRRQILNFALPGDLLGLQASLFSSLEHSVEALSELRLCVFERDNLWDLFEQHPSLAFDVAWLASREERLLDEHLLSIGQRSARERIAHLLLLLFDRARIAGLTNRSRTKMPLTQHHLADALGLSLAHTNRTLRRLENDGLLAWRAGGQLELTDVGALTEIGEYNFDQQSPRPFI